MQDLFWSSLSVRVLRVVRLRFLALRLPPKTVPYAHKRVIESE